MNAMPRFRGFLTLALALVIITLPLTGVQAEGDPAIGVSPGSLSSTLQVGQTDSQALTINNTGATDLTYEVTGGSQVSFAATSTQLYGYMAHGHLKVIGTEDNTLVRVIDLSGGGIIAENTDLDRYGVWDVYLGEGIYFKVEANKPVLGYESDFEVWGHSGFAPSLQGGPIGTEFIFYYHRPPYDWSQVVYVFAMEDASVTIYDAFGALVAEQDMIEGSYWSPPLNAAVYHVVSSGRIAIQWSGENAYTTVPSAEGAGVGQRFYFATYGWGQEAFTVFAYQDADIHVYNLDDSSEVYTQHLDKGANWWQPDVGKRQWRLESTGNVEVWAGDREGASDISGLGDDISFAGGDDGREFYLHSLASGSVIFVPFDDTQIDVDGTLYSRNKDQYLYVPNCCYFRHIRCTQPVVIQTLGNSVEWVDLGTYLGGVTGSGGLPGWLSYAPSSGTVAATGSAAVVVTFDAKGLQPGEYDTELHVRSNDPLTPDIIVPVHMTVQPTDTMGQIQGTVTDAATTNPLRATIAIEGRATLSTAMDGTYHWWLEQGSYNVQASAPGYETETATVTIGAGGTTTQDFTLSLPPPPENDNVEHAKLIDVLQGTFDFVDAPDTTQATSEYNEPCENRKTVWYKMAPTANSCVTVDLAGTSYPTVLSAFRGSPGNWEWVGGCNWTSPGDGDRTLHFTVSAGQTYYILVAASDGLGGTLSFAARGQATVDNDNVANARVIPALPFDESTDTSCSTWDDPTPAGSCFGWGGRNVWYKLTLPQSHFVRISTEGSSYGAPIDVYSGSPRALNHIACGYPTVEFRAPEGQPLYIMIGGEGGNLVLHIKDLGPALDFQVQVKGGAVNAKTGSATLNGVMQCNKPVSVSIWGELRQRLGRGTMIIGGFETRAECTPGAGVPWSVTVRSNQGAYGGGSAEVVGNAWGCASGDDCDEYRIEQVIKMKGGK